MTEPVDPFRDYPFGYDWYPREMPNWPVFHEFTPGELAHVEQMRTAWDLLVKTELVCRNAAIVRALKREPAAVWSDLFRCYIEAPTTASEKLFNAAIMATLVMRLAEQSELAS